MSLKALFGCVLAGIIITMLAVAAKPKTPSDHDRIQTLENTINVMGEILQQQDQDIEELNQRTWQLRKWVEDLGGGPEGEEPGKGNDVVTLTCPKGQNCAVVNLSASVTGDFK